MSSTPGTKYSSDPSGKSDEPRSHWFHASAIVSIEDIKEKGDEEATNNTLAELGQWLVGHLIDEGYTNSEAPPIIPGGEAPAVRQRKESFRGWEYRATQQGRLNPKTAEFEIVCTADAVGVK